MDELVEREPMMFARVEKSVTTFSPKKENAKILDQKQQFNEFCITITVFNMGRYANGEFSFLWPRKNQFGGGGDFKIG